MRKSEYLYCNFLAHKILVTMLALSFIDYCNILLSSLSCYKIKPLESILRSAVSVVYNCEKNNDITVLQCS